MKELMLEFRKFRGDERGEVVATLSLKNFDSEVFKLLSSKYRAYGVTRKIGNTSGLN